MHIIKQTLTNGYVALGMSGTPQEIEGYFNLLYNYNATDATEPISMSDKFAYVVVRWDRFLQALRLSLLMSFLRHAETAEQRRHHQRDANTELKRRLTEITDERFLYNSRQELPIYRLGQITSDLANE